MPHKLFSLRLFINLRPGSQVFCHCFSLIDLHRNFSILFVVSVQYESLFPANIFVFKFARRIYRIRQRGYCFKGTVSRDVLLQVFSWIIFPRAPENIARVILNFFKIGGDIHKSRCTTGFNDTGDNFATGINITGGKFCHWRRCGVADTGGTPVGLPWATKISANFRKRP
jgi:hypothetical protein